VFKTRIGLKCLKSKAIMCFGRFKTKSQNVV
jgi:hypothetical protein